MPHSPRAQVNPNFQSLAGRSLTERDDPAYREYRRRWEQSCRTFTAGDFPLHLDLEITNRCNLRCDFCDKLRSARGTGLGDMDFALFRRIVDQGAEAGLASVKLSYRGEPLLHPQVAAMVAYAKGRGILDVYMNTNGMLLDGDMALALMDAGLDRISVSVDGTDPLAYERHRRGASHARVVGNIEALLRLRAGRGGGPLVRVQTVRLPGLDLEAYAAQWAGRCDEVAAVDLKDDSLRRTGQAAPGWACPQPWQRLTIDWRGTVLGCNNDDDQRAPLGDARTEDIRALWRSPAQERLRLLHSQGLSHLAPACDGCPWRAAQLAKPGASKQREDAHDAG